jgi:hypothetical protein
MIITVKMSNNDIKVMNLVAEEEGIKLEIDTEKISATIQRLKQEE